MPNHWARSHRLQCQHRHKVKLSMRTNGNDLICFNVSSYVSTRNKLLLSLLSKQSLFQLLFIQKSMLQVKLICVFTRFVHIYIIVVKLITIPSQSNHIPSFYLGVFNCIHYIHTVHKLAMLHFHERFLTAIYRPLAAYNTHSGFKFYNS